MISRLHLPKKENNGKAERIPVQISRRAIHNSRGSKILLGLINSKINFHQLEFQ
jgi:hypothetical protein